MDDAVRILGVGMTPFCKHRERTVEDLARTAVLLALRDAGVDRTQVDEAFCGNVYGGSLIGQRALGEIGMTGIPITNVENACSSGSVALREAISAVMLGKARLALAIGVEKLTGFGGGTLPLQEGDAEVEQGMVMPGLYAMRAQRYMHETGATTKHLAGVAVKAHRNAASNPYAQFQNILSIEDVLRSRRVADPLTLYMCCPTGDGAAAAVVTADKRLIDARAIRVDASVLQSGRFTTGFRDLAWSELTARTSHLAFDQAGLGPGDVDLAEVHDAFTIAELMYCEALGFCERGEAKDLLERGETEIAGRIPINPSGGLLCRGHPLGATGIAQVCEAVWQLRGQAGARQVPAAKVALTHCTGGGISGLDHGACAMHLLSR